MTRIVFISTILVAISIASGQAQNTPAIVGGQHELESAAQQGHYAFILFHRTNDRPTQEMRRSLEGTVAQRQNTRMVAVNINDPAERALVNRFDASRTPMPAVVAVAPNGAITGVFPQRVTPQQLASAVVSAGEAECVKGLQDQELVLLHIHRPTNPAVPSGVQKFMRNEQYKGRSRIVNVRADDPAELRFIKQLGLSPQSTGNVVFMAPPGVMVGTFNADVSESVLVQKLVAAGKCCDDPNCKHDRAAHGNHRPRR